MGDMQGQQSTQCHEHGYLRDVVMDMRNDVRALMHCLIGDPEDPNDVGLKGKMDRVEKLTVAMLRGWIWLGCTIGVAVVGAVAIDVYQNGWWRGKSSPAPVIQSTQAPDTTGKWQKATP